jgi:hypothetical protein
VGLWLDVTAGSMTAVIEIVNPCCSVQVSGHGDETQTPRVVALEPQHPNVTPAMVTPPSINATSESTNYRDFGEPSADTSGHPDRSARQPAHCPKPNAD